MSSAQEERLKFIDFRLMFLGDVSRQDLTDRFGISEPVATRDLTEYRERCSTCMEYSHAQRAYLASSNFQPLYEHESAEALAMIAHGHLALPRQERKPFLRCDLPIQLDRPDPHVVSTITRSINHQCVISIDYRSHSSGETRRQIVPFALVDNGLRWHIRAYDRRRARFSDFVISRISNPTVEEAVVLTHERWEHDIQWNRIVELELVPHPNRPHQETTSYEYGMVDGVSRLRVRAAVAGYFLRRWNVDCSPDHKLAGNEYQLWLRNRETLYGVETLEIAPGYNDPSST
ncbi:MULTISPECIES: helix-turn-helix transcriptional regulator [Burkholderia cepacia complex]|nr:MULTISPECIES: WYL domain-containing protein [Burkholderia cepacia complex]